MIYVASHINARSPTINGRSLPIFPCYPNKRPACANGFKDASTDPGWIAELWAGRTGLLVAVPTGRGERHLGLGYRRYGMARSRRVAADARTPNSGRRPTLHL
jgi:hypothetical protein